MKGILLVILVVVALQINGFMGKLKEVPSYIPYTGTSGQEHDESDASKLFPKVSSSQITISAKGLKSNAELLDNPTDLANDEKLAALLDQCIECSEVIRDINKAMGRDLSSKEILSIESLSMRVGLLRESKELYLLVIAKDNESKTVSDTESIYILLRNPF